MKIYITFGQVHIHRVNGKVFDKDCIAVIEADDEKSGRNLAFQYFNDQWFTSYTENNWKDYQLNYYPRGFIEVE